MHVIADWIFDPHSRYLSSGAAKHRLSPKAAMVLLSLLQEPGGVWSRQALLDAVWPDQTVSEEVLTQVIAELRRALGDDFRRPRYIETVHKAGYRLMTAGVAEPSATPWAPLGGWLPDAVLREAHAMTAMRGHAYEGFWRTTRPSIGMPGRFMHDRLMIRKADNGFMTLRVWVEDMRFEGWIFLTQTQLFSVAADPSSGMLMFSIYNAVPRDRAEVLDGLTLAIQRVGGGSPVAGAILMQRCGELSGDPAIDDATYEASIDKDRLAPEGSIPAEIRAHLLPDVGPAAMAAGGPALLMMSFANSLSRGPLRP